MRPSAWSRRAADSALFPPANPRIPRAELTFLMVAQRKRLNYDVPEKGLQPFRLRSHGIPAALLLHSRQPLRAAYWSHLS